MDNYKVLNKIGEGTYGLVYKAVHKETSQVVAIKQFKESDEDEQVRKTAMREIRILKELKHENIVNLIEVFRWKGKIFLVFEYVPHTILEELENNSNGLDPKEAMKFMWQLIRGTEFVHEHNVIHRDIKPENLLISKHGALKICDFGFARFLAGPDSLYTDYVSTRWYRAPELLVGDANYGKGIDVWAIGCLFAELSTGQPLFPGESDLRTLQYILNIVGGKLTDKQRNVLANNPIFEGMDAAKTCCTSNNSSALAQKFPLLPPSAQTFLRGCLAIDPTERPTCAQLIQDAYFEGSLEGFGKDLQEITLKDETEFQMRTKAMLQLQTSPTDAAVSGNAAGNEGAGTESGNIPPLKSIGEDKDESGESDTPPPPMEDYRLPNEPRGMPMAMGKSVNKVTITFNKPKHMAEHSGSSNELNVSFSKKSTKVPPGGGAGPSTMILKDLSNPLKQTTSKRNFKDADFQNPPSFLKGEILAGKHAGAGEATSSAKYALPQLKGKNIQPGGGNLPRANRLVALPQITESKGTAGEKLYLRNPAGKPEGQLDSSFEYKPPYAVGMGLNDSGDENVNPSLFATSLHANKLGKKGADTKSSLFPSIPTVAHQSQNRPSIFNPQPNVKIVDLQHNLLPFEKSTIIIAENGTRIDTHSLKKQLASKKMRAGPGGNKPITPVPSELGMVRQPYMIFDPAQRFSRVNMTPVIYYGH